MGATELVTAFDRGGAGRIRLLGAHHSQRHRLAACAFSREQDGFNGVETDSKLMGAYAVLVGDASYIEQNPLTVQAVLRAMKASTD